MVLDALQGMQFRLVHNHQLIYNTCWEDPRLDREALELGPDDTIAMITSAGCNALDYALCGPKRIDAVDMNPRQNALLNLKIAGIKSLDHATFFDVFGHGRVSNWQEIYQEALRPNVSPEYRAYWDKRGKSFFSGRRRPSFYFRGSAGTFAWFVNVYLNRVAKLRDSVNEVLNAENPDEQKERYQKYELKERLWKPYIRWIVRRNTVMSMLGVPKPQRLQIDGQYPGGLTAYVMDCVEQVFTMLPLTDNYFWRVYLTGQYTPECCPSYLIRENFEQLKAGGVDCIHQHTTTMTDFLNQHDQPVTRFVLLDHMDWMSVKKRHPLLAAEWQAIANRSAPNTRLIWRSAGLDTDFIDPIEIEHGQRKTRVGDLLTYNRALASELHQRDRVHTYGSFSIADFQPAVSV